MKRITKDRNRTTLAPHELVPANCVIPRWCNEAILEEARRRGGQGRSMGRSAIMRETLCGAFEHARPE